MSRPVKREEPEGENEEERGRSLHTAPGYDGTSTKFDQYEKSWSMHIVVWVSSTRSRTLKSRSSCSPV